MRGDLKRRLIARRLSDRFVTGLISLAFSAIFAALAYGVLVKAGVQ